MSKTRPSRNRLPLLSSQVHADDGIDPRKFFDRTSHKSTDRKAQQLCAQAAEALNAALSGECGDAILANLLVASVVPLPGTNRLMVTVDASHVPNGITVVQILERLNCAVGMLRSEVAAAICRKRAPELGFRIAGPTELEL